MSIKSIMKQISVIYPYLLIFAVIITFFVSYINHNESIRGDNTGYVHKSSIEFKIYESFYDIDDNGNRKSHTTILVNTGNPSDWVNTSLYIAKISKDLGFNTGIVDVAEENPWFSKIDSNSESDVKLLSRVSFDSSSYNVTYSNKLTPIYYIEYDEYLKELKDSTMTAYPIDGSSSILRRYEKQKNKITLQAKKYISQKYSLQNNWEDERKEYEAKDHMTVDDDYVLKNQYDENDKTKEIKRCLTYENNGETDNIGCLGKQKNVIIPYKDRHPPIDYNASNLIDANIKIYSKCSVLHKSINNILKKNKKGLLLKKDQSANLVWYFVSLYQEGIKMEYLKDLGNKDPQDSFFNSQFDKIKFIIISDCTLNPNMTIEDSINFAVKDQNIPHYEFYSDEK